MSRVEIVEMGPRDGLQNEKQILNLDVKLDLIKKLYQSGLRRVEIGSFVSPRWVPQMADTQQVCEWMNKQEFSPKVRWGVLVPNLKGYDSARAHGAQEIAVFTAASESFTKKNINCTIDESFARFEPVVMKARKSKVFIRGYVSTAFYCPYEGKVPVKNVVSVVSRLFEMGVREVSIGDTIGAATPGDVRKLLRALSRHVPLKHLALHMHDTRGTALANVLAGFDLGVRIFDSSVGGVGGCPYAPGAAGNVATEDLVYLFDGLGLKSGVNLAQLIEINHWLGKRLGRKLPSRLGQVGVPRS